MAAGLSGGNERSRNERTREMIYRLSKIAQIKIQTLVGEMKEIEVKELVKLGSVSGPLMCCVNSAKINNMRENAMTYITPELFVGALVYIDDIMVAGSKDVVEKVLKT